MPSYLTRNGTSGTWLFIYIETYLHTSLAYIPVVIGKMLENCNDVGNIFGFKPKLIILRIMSCKLVLNSVKSYSLSFQFLQPKPR